MKNIKNWIKENWKDPVWSKVFASIIFGIISLVSSGIYILSLFLIRKISLQESVLEFLRIITLRVPVPLWIILFIIISILVIIIIYFKKNKLNAILPKKELSKTKSKVSNIPTIESTSIGFAKKGYNVSVNSNFLGSKMGIFSIWGYVSDIHNKIHPQRRFMYLVGYATNEGNPFNNPNLANYPNAWAIQRLTPTVEDNNGIWRFWCNNISRDLVHLDYKTHLSGGWHLFSVAWSTEENYIKFIIDDKIVVEEKYINWPTDFSSCLMIGTWPNKHISHFFDSKIGPWRFIESNYKENIIIDYYNKKPE